jgi:translocation and assembly module TamB
MRSWRTYLILAILTAGLTFLIGFSYEYQLPRIERWLLFEVEKQSAEKLPVRVWPQSLKLSIFPPGLILNEVRILPKAQLRAMLAPTTIKKVEIRLNWVYLLAGRFRLSYLGVENAEFKAIIKSSVLPQPKAITSQQRPLDFLADLPVDEIRLDRVTVWARLPKPEMAVHLSNVTLEFENRLKSFFIDFNAPVADIKVSGHKEPIPLNIGLRAFVDEKSARLSALKVKAGRSHFVGAGLIQAGLEPGQWERLDMRTRFQVDLEDSGIWRDIFPSPIWKGARGLIKVDAAIDGTQASPGVKFRVDGKDLLITGREIGNVMSDGHFRDGVIGLDSLSVENSAGQVRVDKFSWRPQAHAPLTGHLVVQNLEVGRLIGLLSFSKVPLIVPATGDFNCEGPAYPDMALKCKGVAKVRDFVLFQPDSRKAPPILEFTKGEAEGEVKITTRAVSYAAKVRLGAKSRGESTGVIDYDKGFSLAYSGQGVNFSDVKSLVNMKFDGTADIKGTTEGTSDWGRAQMQIGLHDFWLENYGVGEATTELTYEKGLLRFDKITGQLGTTRYAAQVGVNLANSQLQIQAQSGYAELSDVRQAFSRYVTLPFEVSGSGSLQLSASGPFQFNHLSYRLRSSFFRGLVGTEGFDQLQFNVDAVKGQVTTDKIILQHGTGSIDLKGRVNPSGIIDSVMTGRRLRIEESEYINRMGLDLAGQLDFTMQITGQLPRPTFESQGNITHLVIGDRASDDSSFKFKIGTDRIEGGARLLGDLVSMDLIYPLTDQAPFQLIAKSNRWNFAHLFSLMSTSLRQRDFSTILTGIIDLRSPQGGFRRATGKLEITEFSLHHGAQGIKNSSPINLTFNEGVMRGKPFALEGDAGFLRLNVSEISNHQLSAAVNGKLDLSLLGLVTPFLSDLQGRLAVNVGFSGSPSEPQISGSAYVEQGVIKFREFPQAFNNLRADVLFSHKDIVVNSVRAELGGGALTGEGRIRLMDSRNIPVDVKGNFNGVTLNVPEGYRTSGSGTWSFSGNFVPYTLGVQYTVEGGEVTAEFAESGGGTTSTPSTFLPRFLVQPSEQPIELDLAILLNKPLPIKNSLVHAQVRGRLKVEGPPNQPRLTGSLTAAPNGHLFFREAPFEIINAEIQYDNDPPDNPKINVTAQTLISESVKDNLNVKQAKENQYEINLLAQGRAKQIKWTLSSMPTLTEKQIVSLLALGMTPGDSATDQSASQIAAQNSVALGSAILQKPLNTEFVKRLGVNLQVSQSNSPTENATYPKVTINKQLTPNLGASAARTFDKRSTNQVKMEYKVNQNFSVIGSWEGKESATQIDQSTDSDQSIFGLDLEYKVNFK